MDTTKKDLYTLWQAHPEQTEYKHRCTDCGAWVETGIVKHGVRCDFKADRTYHQIAYTACAPAALVAETQNSSTPSVAQIVRAGKEGTAALILSEDEIVGAVKRGYISERDALNRDC